MLEAILTGIIGVIAGNASMFLFFRQERRSKTLDNDSKEHDNEAKESEEWKKFYECVHDELREKDQKIDTLYVQISDWRDKYNALASDKAQLEVNNAKMCLLKCEVPSCPNRKPSTGY